MPTISVAYSTLDIVHCLLCQVGRDLRLHLLVSGPIIRLIVIMAMQITMPKDNVHVGNVEHRDLHNQNGQLFHLGTAMVRALRISNFYLSHSTFCLGYIWLLCARNSLRSCAVLQLVVQSAQIRCLDQ